MYPGSIVMFAYTGTTVADRAAVLQRVLTRAGHRVRVVSDARAIADDLRLGQADIILADDTVRAILEAFPRAESPPTVLYLITEKDKKRAAELARQMPVCLKGSDKLPQYLNVIEAAMKSRVQAGARVKSDISRKGDCESEGASDE